MIASQPANQPASQYGYITKLPKKKKTRKFGAIL
jgi:hypothetical protein